MNVLKNFLALRHEQWLPQEKLESLQQKKLDAILTSASRTAHYANLDDFASVPVTEKKQLRESETAFLSCSPNTLHRTQTSGSTGIPVSLFIDQETLDYRVAMKYLVETSFGLSPRDVFAEISHRPHIQHPFLRQFHIFRKVHLSVFDDEKKNFGILRNSRANILGWYPSAVSILAMLNNSMGNPVSLKSVYCGSEMLSKQCRADIESSFSCNAFNQYGAEEFGTIAWECPEEKSLHINSNAVLLEILGSNGKPKKSGSGEIVLTTLHNHAMPLLRYKIGDCGSLGGGCPCGRGLPVLNTLEGRSNDIITLPSGKKRTPVSFDIMYGIPGIREYQVVHERTDLFIFRYVSEQDISEDSRKEILGRMERATLGEKVEIELEHVDKIPKTKSGKLSTVISKVRI